MSSRQQTFSPHYSWRSPRIRGRGVSTRRPLVGGDRRSEAHLKQYIDSHSASSASFGTAVAFMNDEGQLKRADSAIACGIKRG
jgi:hypothetical protein